tara:strand:+ start:4830 stop:6650 length:1821 start_codon:yes stop_codon:yes gene_type:complete
MQSTKTKITAFLIIFLSIIVSFIFWENIHLKPSNNIIENFEGTIYIENNYSHWNETLRYIIFISFPSILYLLYLKISNNFYLPFSHKFLNSNKSLKKKSNVSLFFIVLFLFFLNTLFFKIPSHSLDTLHEGMWLTAGQNFFYYDSFWNNSFITVGWAHEFLIPILSNILFGELSIGGTRFIFIFYQLLNQILLLILAYQLIYYQKFNLDIKNFIFLIFVFVILFLTNFYSPVFSYREIPLILFIISIWNVLNNNKIFINLVFIGLLSSISIYWGLDRGAFLNFALIFFCLFLFYNGEFKNFITTAISIFFGWIFFYIIFGHEEFLNFLKNSIWIYTNIEYIYGIIHPTPFGQGENSSRAGKNLILILLISFLTIFYSLSRNKKFSNNNKIILIILFVISVISYKTALGRSDGPHLKGAMGWCYFSLTFICLINFSIFLKKNNAKKDNFKYLYLIAVSVIFIFISKIILFDGKVFNEKKLVLISHFNKNDSFYYYENNKLDYKNLKTILRNEKCINNMSYDAALPFILSKPTCNKFYFPYSMGGKEIQREYVGLLKNSNSDKIIIKKNDGYIKNSPGKLMKIVFEYLEKNYIIYREVGDYLILQRNI